MDNKKRGVLGLEEIAKSRKICYPAQTILKSFKMHAESGKKFSYKTVKKIADKIYLDVTELAEVRFQVTKIKEVYENKAMKRLNRGYLEIIGEQGLILEYLNKKMQEVVKDKKGFRNPGNN